MHVPIFGMVIVIVVILVILAVVGFAVFGGGSKSNSRPASGVTLNCPYCGKETSAAAVNCKHCKREL